MQAGKPWISCVAFAVPSSTCSANIFNHSFQTKSFTLYEDKCFAASAGAMSLRNGVVVGISNFVLFLILLFCLHEG